MSARSKGDSVQLQQVILNLMLNAFSAMSGTGLAPRRLVIRTKPVDTSTLLIELQDSGTGIAAEQLESIFKPFITSKPDGLGMGLSICRSIIERHGGRISAANNPDRGANVLDHAAGRPRVNPTVWCLRARVNSAVFEPHPAAEATRRRRVDHPRRSTEGPLLTICAAI